MSERICTVEGCERKFVARGLCENHYRRSRYRKAPPGLTEQERFWSKVDKTDGCWLWLAGKTQQGYGQFYPYCSTAVVAHRYSFQLLVGPIPDGLELDHLCRVRHCVNPAHLEPVTKRVNILRGYGRAAISARMETCAQGHAFTVERNGKRHCRVCSNERARIRYAETHVLTRRPPRR